MSKFTDQQYHDASNLDARVELHRRFSTNKHGWYPWIFDILETLPDTAHFLELGCGPAHMWKECVDRIPDGWTIILSDLSEGMVTAAWRNMAVTGRAFKYEQIDAQSIPYPDETFDIVIANHMLYHIPDRQKAFTEIYRVLRPGGNLIAATNGDDHLAELTKWLEQVSPDIDFTSFSSPFTLDNGFDQIVSFFSQVEIRRYDDDLLVTEIEPLIAYLKSSIRVSELPKSTLLDVRQELENIIENQGEIFITKDAGLFMAVK